MTHTQSRACDAADYPFDAAVLFSSLLSFTSDPIALCSSGVCLAASAALTDLLPSDVAAGTVGSHLCDALAPICDDDLGLAHLRRLLSGENGSSSCSVTLKLGPDGYVQATGTFRWLPSSASPDPANAPKAVCFLKLTVLRNERPSHVPYSATPYLHYPEPVIVISPEPRSFPVLFANEAFLTVTGLSYNDVVSRCISLLHTGGEHSHIEDLHQALCAARSCCVPMSLIRKGQDPLPTYLQLEPIRLNGRLVHIIGLYKPASTIQLSNAAAAAVQVLDKGVWISAAAQQQRVVYCNDAHAAILGLPQHQLLDRSWDCWQGEVADAATALGPLREAIGKGEARSVEVVRRLAEGREQWLEVSVTPISSAAGPVDYYMGMVTDISTRKAEQRMLHLMRGALEATQHAITILDTARPDPVVIYCNPAFEALSGYCRQQVLQRPWNLLHGPNTDPTAAAQILDALLHHTAASVELIQYKCNGRKFWDQVLIAPVAGEGGQAQWAVVVQQDTTERKAAEAAFLLRDHALSNLSEGITIADPNLPDAPIVYVNDAFLRITGYSKEEVLGRNCRFLQGPETDMDAVDRIRTATRDGSGITIEILNYRKNGDKFWNLLSITPVKDKGGRLMSLIGVQSNITELIRRKEAEKQLLEAKIAAETATEAKSMFLANMSHEIRTPLNGMIATAQLMLASVLSPEQAELTETILESGNTLLGILGDILDFSKIDHGSVVLQNEAVDLRQTLEACIEIVASDAHKKRLDIAYSFGETVASRPIIGDSIRVRQVLVNILSNAVKFTEVGEVVVTCTAEAPTPLLPASSGSSNGEGPPEGPPGSPLPAAALALAAVAPPAPPPGVSSEDMVRIHITVRDTGIGIGEESAKKLFQCFRQGHESMSRKYGGTGLGLAISKRLAELMNGTIWVESQLGAGSTFHFTMIVPWASADALGPPGGGPPDPSRALLLPPSADLNPSERSMLQGRTVLVDVRHGPTAEQVLQSCRLLGMNPEIASSAAAGSGKAFEMAVISIDRATAAIRAGWKGRPVVALGSKDGLPLGMHPLVMVVSTPVKHSRLATALVKSTSLLKWHAGRGGPKLAGVPISTMTDAFSMLKGWRSRKSTPTPAHFLLDETRRTSLDNSQLDRMAHGGAPGLPPPGFPRTAAYISDTSALVAPCPSPAFPNSSSSSPSPSQPPALSANAAAAAAAAASIASNLLAPATALPPARTRSRTPDFPPCSSSSSSSSATAATTTAAPSPLSNSTLPPPPQPSPQPTAAHPPDPSIAPPPPAPAPTPLADAPPGSSLSSPSLTSLVVSAAPSPFRADAACPWQAAPAASAGDPPIALAPPTSPSTGPPKQPYQPPQYTRQQSLPLVQRLQQEQKEAQQAEAAAAATAAAAAAAAKAKAAVAAGANGGVGGKDGGEAGVPTLRILIAEDNKVNQKVVLKVLQRVVAGCTPDVVENGLEVLAAMERKVYDIILMDIHMPEMDGLEASRLIQQRYPPHERPRIIALSADTLKVLHERCKEAGIEEFITKPFRVEDLQRVMKCSNRVSRQLPAAAPAPAQQQPPHLSHTLASQSASVPAL